jgi:hypothetical protein
VAAAPATMLEKMVVIFIADIRVVDMSELSVVMSFNTL